MLIFEFRHVHQDIGNKKTEDSNSLFLLLNILVENLDFPLFYLTVVAMKFCIKQIAFLMKLYIFAGCCHIYRMCSFFEEINLYLRCSSLLLHWQLYNSRVRFLFPVWVYLVISPLDHITLIILHWWTNCLITGWLLQQCFWDH